MRVVLLTAVAAAIACADTDSSSRAVAQRDSLIIDASQPSCKLCVIEVSEPLQIGSPSDPEIPKGEPEIVRDSRGTHYLTFNYAPGLPTIRYDSLGRYIGEMWRTGEGPGEFTMTSTHFVGPGDSLFIQGEGRIQVFSPAAAYVRSFPFTTGVALGVAPEGGIYSRRQGHDLRDSVTRAYVLRVDTTGLPVDSFEIHSTRMGVFTSSSGAPNVLGRKRAIPTLSPAGDIWTYVDLQYRLEKHSVAGKSVRLIALQLANGGQPVMTEAQAESLIRKDGRVTAAIGRARGPDGPGNITSLQPDTADLLWVFRRERAPRADTINRRYEYRSPDIAPGERTIPADVIDRLHHTVVEVVDARQAQLLARTVLPFYSKPVGPGYAGRIIEDAAGNYIVRVYKLTLRRN